MAIKKLQDADALLLYRVGPIYCCSPTLTVEAVILPPKLTRAPGYNDAEPGVFKHACGVVNVVDLRKRFGVKKDNWESPGKIVIVEVEGGFAGFWVDEIIDVVHFPEKGWSDVPACIPRNVFKRTLLLNKVIQLYCDFESLYKFRETGYLREYIASLEPDEKHVKPEIGDMSGAVIENIEDVGDKKQSEEEPISESAMEEQQIENDIKARHKHKISSAQTNVASSGLVNKSDMEAKGGIRQKPDDKQKSKQPDLSKKEQIEYTAKHYDWQSKAPEKQDSIAGAVDNQDEVVAAYKRFDNEHFQKPVKEALRKDNSAGVFWGVFFTFFVVLSGAGYFLIKKINQQAGIELVEKTEVVEKEIKPEQVKKIETEKEEPFLKDSDSGSNDYHAEINQQNDVITIIINEPVVIEKKNETDQSDEKADINEQGVFNLEESVALPVEPESQIGHKKETVSSEIVHIVVKGDTLWHIAERYINDPYRYPQLARLSKIKNPDLIYPGNKVRIIINRKETLY